MPRVSVITPLYNKGRHVRRTIDSILAQSMEDFELIVVDDGSTDDGPDIVRSYEDPRIRLFSQENQGPGAARNNGMAKSSAPFVAPLDADDEWRTEFLERMLEPLEKHPECAASFCVYSMDSGKGENSRPSWDAAKITPGIWRLSPEATGEQVAAAARATQTGANVFRKDVFLRLGGYFSRDRCRYGEDNFIRLLLLLNHPVYFHPEILMQYCVTASEAAPRIWVKLPPLEPSMAHPELLRDACPPEYAACLERYLSYRALETAVRYSVAGNVGLVWSLMRRFPGMKELGGEYYRAWRRIAYRLCRSPVWKARQVFRLLRARFCSGGPPADS